MALEDLIKNLTAAIEENTAALQAAASDEAGDEKPAKKAPAKKGKKPAAEEPEDEAEEDADEGSEDEAEEDADEGSEDEAEEDDQSEAILAAAKKALVKNKPEVAKILAKLKVKKVSEIPAEKHALALKLLKAVK